MSDDGVALFRFAVEVGDSADSRPKWLKENESGGDGGALMVARSGWREVR